MLLRLTYTGPAERRAHAKLSLLSVSLLGAKAKGLARQTQKEDTNPEVTGEDHEEPADCRCLSDAVQAKKASPVSGAAAPKNLLGSPAAHRPKKPNVSYS